MNDTEPIDLQELILSLVHSPDYQPVKPKVIAKQLGVPKERARELRKAVKRLAREGKIAYGENHLIRQAGPARKPRMPATPWAPAAMAARARSGPSTPPRG